MRKIFNLILLTTIPFWQLRPPTVPAIQILTRNIDQAGTNKFCFSSDTTISYTCSLGNSWKLQSYTMGMVIVFYNPTTSCTSTLNCTLNIDNLGALPIQGGYQAGVAELLFYNSTTNSFQLLL